VSAGQSALSLSLAMVGVTYRNNNCRPGGQRGGQGGPPVPRAGSPSKTVPVVQTPSFKDKESYQDLFKPLPKPEPIPTLGGALRIEAKSWKQLQEEREALMTREIQKTKDEAVSFWDRAKEEDNKRMAVINKEKTRIEEEQRKRELLQKSANEERLEKDRTRKMEIKRQEELLAGRTARARTEGPYNQIPGYGGGIQVFHYKDPVVEDIVRNTYKEEIRRRMSHGDILRGFNSDPQPMSPTENSKADFFNAEVMLRSQSSSSTTSR